VKKYFHSNVKITNSSVFLLMLEINWVSYVENEAQRLNIVPF